MMYFARIGAAQSHFTAPRLRGEVGAQRRVRGTLQDLGAWKKPLTPTLPRKNGEREQKERLQLNLISSCSRDCERENPISTRPRRPTEQRSPLTSGRLRVPQILPQPCRA